MSLIRLRYLILFFFILVNTSYFWKKLPDQSGFLVALFLLAGYVALYAVAVFQIVLLIRERLKNGKRNTTVVLLCTILGLATFFPNGLIDFSRFEKPALLTAEREGTASCRSYIKLKTESRFIEIHACFGESAYEGTYRQRGDSLFFTYDHQSSAGQKQALGVLQWQRAPSGQVSGILHYYPVRAERRNIPLRITHVDPGFASRSQ